MNVTSCDKQSTGMVSMAGLTPRCAPGCQGEEDSCGVAGNSGTLKQGQSRSERLQILAGIVGTQLRQGARQGKGRDGEAQHPQVPSISCIPDHGEQHLSTHEKGTIFLVMSYLQAPLAKSHLT